MHPAPSIIAFTTLSGLGFGLMAWLGLGGGQPSGSRCAFLLSALAVALVGAGLLASLLHLGQPTRFLKAFTQWRSSWLSREAILAIATLAVFGLFAGLWVLFGLRTRWLGVPAAALALATVIATAMIYAQLRSVPRWRSPLTPILFLLFALAGGALLAGAAVPASWLLAALGLVQLAAWARRRRPPRPHPAPRSPPPPASAPSAGCACSSRRTPARTTSCARWSTSSAAATPLKLRVIGLLLAVAAAPRARRSPPPGPSPSPLAAVAHAAGALVLRWLFFAEAEHVVGLYYGRR